MSEATDQKKFDKALNEFAVRIRDAVIKISETTPTSGRSVIDGYLRHISPTLCGAGDSNFPQPVRGNRIDPEHCDVGGGKYTVLCFHIGNAIMAFYAAAVGREITRQLQLRTDLLCSIAKHGLKEFVVGGSLRTGFFLEKIKHEVQPKPTGQKPLVAGGRGNPQSPPAVHGRPGQSDSK